MDKETGKKLLELQERVWQDEEFRILSMEHQVRNEQFLEVMEKISREYQDTIWDYLGVLVEMHHKIVELALKK